MYVFCDPFSFLFNKKPLSPMGENCQEYVLNNLLLKKFFPLFFITLSSPSKNLGLGTNSAWL